MKHIVDSTTDMDAIFGPAPKVSRDEYCLFCTRVAIVNPDHAILVGHLKGTHS